MAARGLFLEQLREERSIGWIYIEPVYALLKEYEANRDEYPDFRSFYPRILDLFALLVAQQSM